MNALGCVGAGGTLSWNGDGFCDDQNNNEACEFDGGDCCGDNVKTQYCTQCQCLEPSKGSFFSFLQQRQCQNSILHKMSMSWKWRV